MRTSKILLLICFVFALLVAHQAWGKESGECVANEAGECINPDAEQPPAKEETVNSPADIKSDEIVEETESPVASEETETQETGSEADVEETTEEKTEETATEEAPEPTDEKAEDETPVVEDGAVKEDVTTTKTETAIESVEEENTPGCPSRSHVIACASKYLDTNGNQFLERAELQAAIDKLPWFSRGILNILGSVDKMMAKCDMDGDDAIGLDYDMKHNGETCLATCFKRRAFKTAFFADCEV